MVKKSMKSLTISHSSFVFRHCNINRSCNIKRSTSNRHLSISASSNETNLPFKLVKRGKVRDIYESDDKLICVTTDRQSAFDRVIAEVPYKGQALNMTSAWWFFKTESIVDNALISVPHPNVSIMRKLNVFPVEIIVRGYITGTTNTSLWTIYNEGKRDYCGNILPNGMVKNQKLVCPIITPTTKGDIDVPISGEDIIKNKYMTVEQWKYISKAAMDLFIYGQFEANKQGLILVDTKYEFGYDTYGNIYLIDEMHTPDSSRYWIKDTYMDRFQEGKEPENIDKEFLRLWFKEHSDPYNDEVLPEAPKELVDELSKRYMYLFETITGQKFYPFEFDEEEITESINAFLDLRLI